jgi:hypothetical protein
MAGVGAPAVAKQTVRTCFAVRADQSRSEQPERDVPTLQLTDRKLLSQQLDGNMVCSAAGSGSLSRLKVQTQCAAICLNQHLLHHRDLTSKHIPTDTNLETSGVRRGRAGGPVAHPARTGACTLASGERTNQVA